MRETRQERREKRLSSRKKKIPQHGKNLAKIYKDVTVKRAKLR